MNLLVVVLSDAQATFDWLLRTSLHVALLVAVVLFVTMLAGRRLSPGCRHALWLLVAVRMALPVLPSSPWSAFNLVDAERTIVAASSAGAIVGEPESGWIITKDPLPGQRPQAITQVVQADRLDWNRRHGVLLAWLIGVVGFLARVIIANVIFAVRIRRGTGVDDTGVLALLCACRRDMNVTTPVRLIATDAVRGPALWGMLRPTMIIPPAMLRELSREDLRFVFLHELAHLKRRDIAVDWALSLLHAFHWFNPAVWLALSRLRAERELSRDAMVLAVTDAREERGYGRTILKLVQAISRPGVLRPGAVGILEEKTELKRRIAMIARFDRNGSRGRGLAVALALLIACVLLTDKRVADAAAPTEDDPAQKLAQNPAAQPRGAEKPQPPPEWPDAKEVTKAEAVEDADARAEKQLARELPGVRFDNVSLGDAIDFLRDVSGANIFVNWRALEAAGIERNAPVTTRLKNVKLSRAIEHILQNVGGGRIELGFVVKEGVVTISTTEDLDRDTEVRVYDVRDLIVVEEKDEKAAQKKREELVTSIIDMLQETVHPDSWVAKGGKIGNVRHLSGQLVVTHTPRHHVQLEQLLGQLRETRALHISIEVRLITTTPEIVKRLDLEQPEGDAAAAVLGEPELQALLRAVQADANATILTAPRMTLVNGQNGQLRMGNEQPYVKDIKPVNGNFQPDVATNFEGLSLDVTATAAADRRHVTLRGHLRTSKLTGMEAARWQHAPAGRDDLVVHVPRMAVREWKSVVSVPDGRTIATVLDVPAEAREKGAGPARLVVLIRPRIVVQREVEQQAVPLLRGRDDAKK